MFSAIFLTCVDFLITFLLWMMFPKQDYLIDYYRIHKT